MVVRNPGTSTVGLSDLLGVTDRHASRLAIRLEGLGWITRRRVGKQVRLEPVEGTVIKEALISIDGICRRRRIDAEALLEPSTNLALIALLGTGPKTMEWMVSSLGLSRSTIYRILGTFGKKGVGLVVGEGARERTYFLKEDHPLHRPLLDLSLGLFELGVVEPPAVRINRYTTLGSRALVYLRGFLNVQDNYVMPLEVTQKGIASALWTTQPIISKELKRLLDSGSVRSRKVRVRNLKRKGKTYHLTERGIRESDTILSDISRYQVEVVDFDGVKVSIPLERVPSFFNTHVDIVDVLNYLVDEEAIICSRFQKRLESTRESDFISELHRSPQVRYFYGREREKRRLLKWLRGDKKVLFLTGEAGMGKTTFLSKAIQDLRTTWNIFYYMLNEWSTPRSILNNLSIYLQSEDNPDLRRYVQNRADFRLDEAVHILDRSLSSMRSLLIFDDVQNGDERSSGLIRSILSRGSKGQKVILSGRNIPEGLSNLVEGPGMVLEGLDPEASRKLLMSRGVEQVDLERMIEMAGGNPLALELIPLGDYEGHSDLGALIENGVIPNLGEEDRLRLAYFSVFRYPFTADALLILGSFTTEEGGIEVYSCPVDRKRAQADEREHTRCIKALEELASRSFLTYSGNGFRLHDIFREILYVSMDRSLKSDLHLVAANYYCGLRNDPARVEVIDHLISGGAHEEALEHLRAYGSSLIKRGYSEDLVEVVSRIDPEGIRRTSRIDYHFFLGEMDYILGRWEDAARNYRVSVKLCGSEGREELMTRAKIRLARIFMTQGDRDAAVREYGEVIDLARRYDQFILESYGVRHLGSIHYLTGDVEEASRYHKRALEIADGTGSKECLANAYFLASLLCQLRKEFGKCEVQMKASMRIWDELGDNSEKLKIMNNLAWIYSLDERYDESLKLCEQMMDISGSIGDLLNLGFGLLNSADVLVKKGVYEEAERRLEAAYRHFVVLDERRMIHATEQTFATLYRRKGMYDRARAYFNMSIEGLEAQNIVNQLPEVFHEYALMELDCGDSDSARALCERGLQHANRMKDRLWIEKLTELKGRIDV